MRRSKSDKPSSSVSTKGGNERRKSGLRYSRSEKFIGAGTGLFKGQVVGPENIKNEPASRVFLNYDDINKRAIQLFHTEQLPRPLEQADKFWFLRIFHPYDRSRRLFDLTTVVWVLLLVFFIPFEIGFDWYEPPSWQKVLYTILDFWFAADIILNFRTGYINHGTVVMDPKKISQNYLATWFLVDAVGTFPFERLLSGDVASRKSLKLTKYFKIPKLLRISRLMKYVRSHKYVYDFSKVLVLIFTMLHVGACVWVLVLDPCDEDVSNYAGDAICAQESTYRLYAEALHLSATMLLGVSNSHIVEKSELLDLDFKARKEDATKLYLTSTVFMVVGLFLIALLISEANVYVMGKMQGSAAFQSKTDRVNYEMEYYGVPPDLQVQVRAFYDYVWIHQRQYDDKIALLSDQQMSTDLQRKLALHLFKDVVSHISFFSELDDLLLGEICMSLRTRIFLPQDMIILKGDVGKELFIIAKGVVEVLRDDLEPRLRHNAPQILLRNGSFFGEIALVMEVRRTCSVQAKTVCEVNVLQQAAFDSVLRANPHFARRMNELVVARQLDSSLVRSHVKGLDFQVSQSDLDRAVAAMEKNMKEGLERRQMIRSPSSNAIPEMKNTVKFSPSVRVSFDDSMVGRTKRRHPGYQQTDEESQIELPIRPATAGAAPLSDVISDITRRSTRFADEELLKKIHRADRPNSSGVKVEPDSLPDFVDSYSDTEVESSKDRPKDYVRRGSIIDMSTVKVLKPDADVDRALHMPDVFDIRKVRPVILNSHLESSDHNNSDVRSLNARISYQGKMMQQLLSKLDQLETRTKAAIRKGSVDENVK